MSKQTSVERADFHLKVIQEIGELVNQSTGLDNILKGVVTKIGSSLHFDVVSIYLWNEKDRELVLKATRGLKVDDANPIRLKPEEGLTGLVYQCRRPLVVMPASSHPRYKYFPEIGEEEYESYIGVPILLRNVCLGVLVGQTKERRLINPAEETLFQIIASRLAGVLEVADRLERLKSPTRLLGKTRSYQGKGVSAGFAVGEAFIFRDVFWGVDTGKLKFSGSEEEVKRLYKAFLDIEEELGNLIKMLKEGEVLLEDEIAIFEAHLLIVKSVTFQDSIAKRIRDKNIVAEVAVIEEVESIARHFEGMEGAYLRERAQDFRDIGARIIQALLKSRGEKESSYPVPKEGSVIVAYDVGPSVVSMLLKSRVSAIVTEKGGETSHIVILAKSLGIPAVVGIENVCNLIEPGDRVLVDGKTGFIFLNPDDSLVSEYISAYQKLTRIKEVIERETTQTDKAEISIMLTANIGFPVDVDMARQYNIKDVGLFRTEFAFAQYEKWPSVEEQVKIYETVGRYFEGFVTIRTLDIGADKLLPYFSFPKEENPLLGLRAIRFSMEYLDLFRDQIKAVLLAMTEGKRFRILLPMISNLWEVETAREIMEQVGMEIGVTSSELPELGVMLEVPATFYQLEDYGDLVDFVSVGTNDLVQYLLAVDRNSNVVGHLYSSFHPSIVRMLKDVLAKAESVGKEISVCGEMAGTSLGALCLVSLGYRILSVSPYHVPVIRYLCSRVNEELLASVRSVVLSEKKESEIRRYLLEVIESIDPRLIEVD